MPCGINLTSTGKTSTREISAFSVHCACIFCAHWVTLVTTSMMLSQRQGELFVSTSGSDNHGAFGVGMHWRRNSDGFFHIRDTGVLVF